MARVKGESKYASLKMNRNCYVYEEGGPLLNASFFTLKLEFRPNSVRMTPETQEPFNQNNKTLFLKY